MSHAYGTNLRLHKLDGFLSGLFCDAQFTNLIPIVRGSNLRHSWALDRRLGNLR